MVFPLPKRVTSLLPDTLFTDTKERSKIEWESITEVRLCVDPTLKDSDLIHILLTPKETSKHHVGFIVVYCVGWMSWISDSRVNFPTIKRDSSVSMVRRYFGTYGSHVTPYVISGGRYYKP